MTTPWRVPNEPRFPGRQTRIPQRPGGGSVPPPREDQADEGSSDPSPRPPGPWEQPTRPLPTQSSLPRAGGFWLWVALKWIVRHFRGVIKVLFLLWIFGWAFEAYQMLIQPLVRFVAWLRGWVPW
ncbi:MAG: hypothetical protein HQL51_14605 [Magnetococcales bacterium]|nr:hypothetical protein [Magnetococcales bacterium]